MKPWRARSRESANLLNPAFTSVLLVTAARGFHSEAKSHMPLILAFLILPLVLHEENRLTLPKSMATKLTLWAERNNRVLLSFPELMAGLVAVTREALLFAGANSTIVFDSDGAIIASEITASEKNVLKEISLECAEAHRKAHFVGRWLASSGDPSTIYSIFGVRP